MKILITEQQFKRLVENIIKEGLKSYPSHIIERKLKDYFDRLEYNEKEYFFTKVESPYYQIITDEKMIKKYQPEFNYNIKYHDISLFYDNNNEKILKDVISIINSGGYFISVANKLGEPHNKITDKNKIYDLLKNENSISLMIEPIYGEAISKYKNKYLYHTTPIKYLNNIMKTGLVPKTKDKRSFYPGRIYLSPNLKWNESIKTQLESETNEDYVTLRVTNFKDMKLYPDIRFKGGYFTYDNIRPENIDIYEG